MNNSMSKTLTISVGANIKGPAGSPTSTLIAVRPVIEETINEWINAFLNESFEKKPVIFRWSALFKTTPRGGPKNQPSFINAVLVINGGAFTSLNPSVEASTDGIRLVKAPPLIIKTALIKLG